MSVPERLTTVVEVTGKGVTDAERGTTRVEVKVAELGLKDYSTPLFVDATDAQSMEPGQNYLASLIRGPVKRDKDGTYASHYFWNWGGFGDPNQVAAQAEAAAGAPPLVQAAQNLGGQVVGQTPAQTSQTVGQMFVDAKNMSIERQTAAKAATDMYVAQVSNGLQPDWDSNFAQVLDRIQNGPVETHYNADGELEQPIAPDSVEVPEVPFA